VAASTLKEVGIKTNQLDGHLFAAVDYFIQVRTDFAAQDEVSNNATQAKGLEFETRYVVNPEVTITGAFTSMSVYNLSAAASAGERRIAFRTRKVGGQCPGQEPYRCALLPFELSRPVRQFGGAAGTAA
jgi:outer membrane receptor protein involved in Fe transport